MIGNDDFTSLDWEEAFPNFNHSGCVEDEEDGFVWLTEEDELIAAYGRHNLEFVRNQPSADDSLEHYLGKDEA